MYGHTLQNEYTNDEQFTLSKAIAKTLLYVISTHADADPSLDDVQDLHLVA